MKTKLNKDKIQKIIEYSIICFYLSTKKELNNKKQV